MNPDPTVHRRFPAGLAAVLMVLSLAAGGLSVEPPGGGPDRQTLRRGKIKVLYEMDGSYSNLSALQMSGLIYGSLSELAELIGVRTFFNPDNKKTVLRCGSRGLKVTALNPYVLVDESAYQMAVPTEFLEGEIYVPLNAFLETVGDFLPAQCRFDENPLLLRVSNYRYNITGIESEEKLNGLLIRIVTTRHFQEKEIATSINREWLNITLYNGTLDSVAIVSEEPVGAIRKILPFQFAESAQLSLDIGSGLADPQVYIEPGEVLISLRNPSKEPVGTVPEPSREEERKKWLFDRIVLDPGHGGKDPGTIGRRGTREKDINLEIAKRLKRELEKELGVEVIMTRDDDRYLTLKERTQIANAKGGKLFISIHANSNKVQRFRGFSTFFLGPKRTDEALAVAEAENSVVREYESEEAYKDYQEAAHILNSIAQSSYLRESQDLAAMVNESFKQTVRAIPIFGNGVYQDNFWVLVGPAMPKILIETGFLSNEYEEKLLKRKDIQPRIVDAIVDGIRKFKEKFERGIEAGGD